MGRELKYILIIIQTTRALKCKTLGVVCVPKSRIFRQGRVMRMLDKINYWAGSCNLWIVRY